MSNISEHITYNEAIRSDTAKKLGIKNIPDDSQLHRMRLLAENVFEPVRNYFNVPIFISSFFRSAKLNKVLKGAVNSEHLALEGAAMDLDAQLFGKLTNKQIFDYIRSNLDFNQLIWEFGNNVEPDWVHVSYSEGKNKKEVLRAISMNGITRYKKFEDV